MKKIILIVLFLLMLTSFVGCGNKDVSIIDREGNEVIISHKIDRIISTAPSNTEVLIGLGLADKIVAVDNYSSTVGLSSDTTLIDFRSPDAETIIGLNPDIIIASGHNKSGVDDPFAILKDAGIAVVYIPSSNSLEGIYEDINFISEITNTKEKGQAMITAMKTEVAEIKAIADTIMDKKSVYFEISPAPNIYTTGSGTFQDEMITLIGAENIFGDEQGWIAASPEVIVEKNPEIILTNVSYVDNPISDIMGREGFKGVDAIINEKVFLIDANTSSRPSQNVIQAIKEMAKAVYPEYYE